MKMTINEVMIRHNFINKILFKDDTSSLDKDLKVKIMSMRIEYGKIRKSLEEDLKEFVNSLTTDDMKILASKPDKTPEEINQIQSWNNQIKDEYNTYISKRGREEVNIINDTFTEDEYNQIVKVNTENDVEINGTHLNAPDFLEVIYNLFVA
ncbi:hypothetical protein [Intestinibacter sp.]|uniref:hypothetical protein n=1 Tax=Intestinibacter sp. TaxID=1965304 RepID=UPI002A75EC28|nr:hypothetical protein [Intestinibacter sp.]